MGIADDQNHLPPKPAKKTYTTPSFEYEHVFETNALSCGKVSSTQFGCHSNRKLS